MKEEQKVEVSCHDFSTSSIYPVFDRLPLASGNGLKFLILSYLSSIKGIFRHRLFVDIPQTLEVTSMSGQLVQMIVGSKGCFVFTI